MKKIKKIDNKKEFLELLEKCDEKAVIDLMQRASRDIRIDSEAVMAAVKKNGLALEHAAQDLRKKEDIVVAAFLQNYKALQHADDKFKDDQKFMIWAVTKEPLALEFASENRKNDPAVVVPAVNQNGLALKHASETQQKNENVVRIAIQQNGLALQYAPEFQDNIYDVLDAVKQNGLALQFAPAFQTNKDSVNREVVKAAVGQNVGAIKYAPDFENDEEVLKAMWLGEPKKVLNALKDGATFEEAFNGTSDELRSNGEFMKIVVKKYGIDALHCATEELRKDKTFMAEVININPEAFEYAKGGLLKNRSLKNLSEFIKQESYTQKEEPSNKAYKLATDLENKINILNFSITGKTTQRLKTEIDKIPDPEKDYAETEHKDTETSL